MIGVLELASRVKYGFTSRKSPMYLFRPLDQKLGLCIVGCRQISTTNVLALVKVEEANRGADLPRGNLEKIVGNCGDFTAEQEALIHQYSAGTWKDEPITPPKIERPLLKGISINVDPPGCRDIDDVFTFGDDGYFYITIADVSEWMKANPHLWNKANRIAQTMYRDGHIVRPMLPLECSLEPGKERLGVSLRCKITDKIEDVSFLKTKIINNTSYTYEEISKSWHADRLKNIAKILGKDTNDPHEWIAQCMIFYNVEAAKVLVQHNKGLLRAHESPDLEKFETYKKLGLEFLSFKSAVYTTDMNALHWSINTKYCHSTSPIRRFADIVNQFVLKGEEYPEFNVEMLNERTKDMKNYERDSFFLDQLQTDTRQVKGIVLNDHRIWVPIWNRIITCKNTYEEGVSGLLYYSLDMKQSTWKRRMVFRFEDTKNQEQQIHE